MRGGKARSKTGFQIYVQKWFVQNSGSVPQTKKPELSLNLRAIRIAGNHLVMYLEVLLSLRRKEAVGDDIPDCCHLVLYHHSL